MATFNLGAIRFNWKGAYNNSTAYVADDVVSSGGNSYICILASTGNAVSNATYWSIMSSAGTDGTDGTDVGTTITTLGDVLYRDGSGLQRLAKGTASQALTMNAGATAPEWTTPAGGFTLATAQATTSGSTTTFSGIPAGTKVIHVNWVGVSTNGTQELQMRIGDAGGIETSGYTSTSASAHSSGHSMDSDGGAFKVGSSNNTSDTIHGTMILSLENAAAFTWCSMGVLMSINSSEMEMSAGSKSLSAELTQLDIWLPGGNTFDAGAINISYQ